MFRLFRAVLLAGVAVAFAAPVSAQQQQPPQDNSVLKATHGAWQVRCAANDDKRCLMLQDGNRPDGQTVLKVAFRSTPGATMPNGDPIAAVFQVEAPIGVALRPGVAISIDGKQVGVALFNFCTPASCLVSEPVSDQFVTQMKRGTNALLTVVGVNGEKADITISLSGFTKAFNGL